MFISFFAVLSTQSASPSNRLSPRPVVRSPSRFRHWNVYSAARIHRTGISQEFLFRLPYLLLACDVHQPRTASPSQKPNPAKITQTATLPAM